MKTCINIALLLLGLTANAPMLAQQWCPPGAEWRYPYITQLHPQQGTLRYTYEGDSLYQGEVCQHFESRVYFPDQTQWGPWHSFTTTAPSVILFWNTLASQFDTLVNFDAMPGSGWSFIGFQSQEYFITVQDTGVSTIDGIPLRYLVITSEPPWFGLPADTIYERIGALNLHNFSPIENYFMETPTLNGVGCYQDEGMQYSRPFPTWLATLCDIALSTLDRSSMSSTPLSVFPNPGDDRLWLAPLPGGDQYRLLVIDEAGRPIGEWAMDGMCMELNTSEWARGVYLLELIDERSLRRSVKWIKQ
jgi:hypothetical protein